MRVLWLASWYPSKVNFLDGDFIERHAEAASLFNKIFVIHVVKSPTLPKNKIEKQEKIYSDNFSALIYYYPSFQKSGKLVDGIISNLFFCSLHFRAYKYYKKKFGRPQGILVQTGMKAGLIAVLFKFFFGIKYILFERWAGILKEAKPNFRDLIWIKKWLWKGVFRQSVILVTVSRYFGDSINQYCLKKEFRVIPNTVRENLFFPVEKNKNAIFRFIHISNMDYQKNFEDILKAFAILSGEGFSCILDVYGPVKPAIQALTSRLKLESKVLYHGEVIHEKIAKAVQEANALILYSRYESFGNVLLEANACGLPVIVSDYPVFKDIIQEGITGIVAEGENPAALAKKMEWMINNYSMFNAQVISSIVREKYGYVPVGKLFDELFIDFFS